jgi:uncharacterized glyoxalase superfamily protein PhnB
MSREIDLLRSLHPDAAARPDELAVEKLKLMAFIEGMRRAAPPVMPRVIPHLVYSDVAGAIPWLTRAFGFAELQSLRVLDEDGSIGHCAMSVGDPEGRGVVMMGPPSVHGGAPSGGVSATVHIYVRDIERHYARAVEAGARILIPLETAPWGDRRYQAADPEGRLWHFAECK